MRRLSLLLLSSAAVWLVADVARADPPELGDALEAELGRPSGITASEAAERATAGSPTVRAAEADLDAASEQTTVATLAYLPRLTARARYTRLSEVDQSTELPIEIPSIVNQWTTELALDVPLSDYLVRLPEERRAAERTEEATRESVDATRRGVAYRARLVYWGWARAKLAVSVTEQAAAQASAHLADTRAMLEVGHASLADVLRAEGQLAARQNAVVRARADEARLADELRTIAHLPDRQRLEIGEALADAPEEQPRELRALLEEAYALRADLHAKHLMADAERSRATAVRTGAFPRLSGFAATQLLNPNQRSFPQQEAWDTGWYAGVELTWGLTSIPSTLAQARASDARADRYDAEQAELRDAIRNDVVDASESYRAAEASIEATGRELRAAEEQHRVSRELFVAGRAPASSVVDAETELTNARLDAIQARIDREVAAVHLAAAMGR